MQKNKLRRIGIMTAMPQELALLSKRYEAHDSRTVAGRTFLSARHGDAELVLVHSGIGKVASASTATILLHEFEVDYIVFTGVAGAIHHDVNVGDIVVASHLAQYDFDLKGVLEYQRFTIPSLGLSHIPVRESLVKVAHDAAARTATHLTYKEGVGEFTPSQLRVHCGLIASGDTFISDSSFRLELQDALPDLLAVEMEGGAVAQVCTEHDVPFVVVRVISDSADDSAHFDFVRFIDRAAAIGSDIFVQELLQRL
jgi:adenosylhomocysteine nucleosidase